MVACIADNGDESNKVNQTCKLPDALEPWLISYNHLIIKIISLDEENHIDQDVYSRLMTLFTNILITTGMVE